jgi:hypothetical protein
MLHFESVAAANNDEAILKSIDVAFMDAIHRVSHNYDIPLDTLTEQAVKYIERQHGKH